MIWEEVERKYGKKTADKMRKSKYLTGITMVLRNDGKLDIPERDIENAYNNTKGKPVYDWD